MPREMGHIKTVRECATCEPKALEVAEAISFHCSLCLNPNPSWLEDFYVLFCFPLGEMGVGSHCSPATRNPLPLEGQQLCFSSLSVWTVLPLREGRSPPVFCSFPRWLSGCGVESSSDFLTVSTEAPVHERVDECDYSNRGLEFLNGSDCVVCHKPFL